MFRTSLGFFKGFLGLSLGLCLGFLLGFFRAFLKGLFRGFRASRAFRVATANPRQIEYYFCSNADRIVLELFFCPDGADRIFPAVQIECFPMSCFGVVSGLRVIFENA